MLENPVLTGQPALALGVLTSLRTSKVSGGRKIQMRLTQGDLLIDTQPSRFSPSGFTDSLQEQF